MTTELSAHTVDLAAEQRKIIRFSGLAFLFCCLVLGSSYICLPKYFEFPVGLPERMAFAAQTNLFILAWVLLGVRMVSKRRFHSATDSIGSAYSSPSPAIRVQVAFLQNTLEQSVITAGGYFALATLLSGPALALIPSAAALFAVGRLTFLVGYPNGAGARAFGMAVTAIPTLASYVLAGALLMAQLLQHRL